MRVLTCAASYVRDRLFFESTFCELAASKRDRLFTDSTFCELAAGKRDQLFIESEGSNVTISDQGKFQCIDIEMGSREF